MEVPVLATMVVSILGLAVDSGRAEKILALLTKSLATSPSNVAIQNAILATIRNNAHLSEAASQKVYEIALHALTENSLPAAQNFALEIGRQHVGRSRSDKKPSLHLRRCTAALEQRVPGLHIHVSWDGSRDECANCTAIAPVQYIVGSYPISHLARDLADDLREALADFAQDEKIQGLIDNLRNSEVRTA